ncbi:MAG: FGGY-family carbohydrate kinase [Peptococcaceae bacterium]|nr:FGGY-family carbohydrate kinase [Peptococcaceae bacterium]
MSLIFGYDAGTHGIRALAYDTRRRAIVAAAKSEYRRITAPGIQELEPDRLWRSFREATARLGEALPLGAAAEALAITHQRGTVLPVDAAMRPLANARCDSDGRALGAGELSEYGISAADYYRKTGCPFLSFNGAAKVLWCHKNAPELYARAAAWLSPQDYLASRLRGRLVQSAGSATRGGLYDIDGRRAARGLFPALGENQPNAGLPCVEPGRCLGEATAATVAELPPLRGAALVAAPGDQPAALLGCGAAGRGQIAVNLGTTYVASMTADAPAFDPECLVTVEILPEGGYAPEFGTGAGGQFMDWLSALLLGRMPSGQREWDALDALTQSVPAGSEGLLAVPLLWQVTSAGVRGRFANLASFHTRGHFLRSVYEGLAYETRLAVERLERIGGRAAAAVKVFGGMSENRRLLAILASVLRRPVQAAYQKQASACGALLCAARAAGHFDNLAKALTWADQIRATYMPNDKEAAYYDGGFTSYRDAR